MYGGLLQGVMFVCARIFPRLPTFHFMVAIDSALRTATGQGFEKFRSHDTPMVDKDRRPITFDLTLCFAAPFSGGGGLQASWICFLV